MFRVWGKIMKDNHLIRDVVAEIPDEELRRTQKVYKALDKICYELDLSTPLWLDLNIHDFKCHARTRFTSDNFVEPIDFDYLDFHVIEE